MNENEIGKLPREVYYQCVWIIKDAERLSGMETLWVQSMGRRDGTDFSEGEWYIVNENALIEAAAKMECIREAVRVIPEEYRKRTLESIMNGKNSGFEAHENTWKKWRRVFIKELARRLNLI